MIDDNDGHNFRSSTPTPSLPATPSNLPLIVGVAGGGAVMLCLILMLCVCVCVCCARQKARRNKTFNLSAVEKLPKDSSASGYRTLTPPRVNVDEKEVNSSTSNECQLENQFSRIATLFSEER